MSKLSYYHAEKSKSAKIGHFLKQHSIVNAYNVIDLIRQKYSLFFRDDDGPKGDLKVYY